MDMSRDCESEIAAVCGAPKTQPMMPMIVANSLLSDFCEGQFEKQDDISEHETELSKEERNEVSEMSPENRELRESFLNTSDCYHPRQIFTTVQASENYDNDGDDPEAEEQNEVESVPPSLQVKDLPECSEEVDSDWTEDKVSEMTSDNVHASDVEEKPVCPGSQKKDSSERSKDEDFNWSNEGLSEIKDLNSDAFNQLHVLSPTEIKLNLSEIQQNLMPLRPTASEAEEKPDQSTKKPAKKVRFSEQVTIYIVPAWDTESQAARNGSCWIMMARDRIVFNQRVRNAERFLGMRLTAQHLAVLRRIH